MPLKIFDPSTLPPHFEAAAKEAQWDGVWEQSGIYRWNPARGRGETFVVDTPPPTVSGSLHMGHVFSYTHTDVLVRQRRMLGQNIFYPMGWDDNGLPTERRVQNFFHVRCDPTLPYEAPSSGNGIDIDQADDAKRKNERPRIVSRRAFIELCARVTHEDEKAFEQLFRRIALSVDWTQTYATIDERCRHLAQLSFVDLVEKGQLYNVEAPTMWDVDFQTALAQADLKDEERPGAYHDLEFAIEGTDESFVISTTRPELLPACVGACAHPDDERFKKYFGKRAITPLFRAPVRIFPSELADPKKGTGILMVCTFGDATDVTWWREQKLPTRQILGKDGRVRAVEFGSEQFPSLDASAANAAFAQLVGKNVTQAQKTIVELLRDPASSATGRGAPLQGEPKKIVHPVKMYEKGERPLEFITTRQWFVKLLQNQAGLLEKGKQIAWHPEFMHARFHNWTENLNGDWCISRQRYFGVPIPVWYPVGSDGAIDHEHPIHPAREQLPVDPLSDAPKGFTESQRNQPGGFSGDPDVFDTWFTSSLTPQIGAHWLLDPERHAKLFPADIRPQSHEIIRTWAFYTIAKAMLHEGKVPWNHVVISGWILDPDRKKMSKSVGNVVTPMKLLEDYTSDGVRYWAASARLGMDTAFDEKVLKVGKRLVTKLFNAGKYVFAQSFGDAEISLDANNEELITHEIDRAFIGKLRALITKSTESFAEFEYANALMATEQFFWSQFTDAYLELVKARARGDGGVDDSGRVSAIMTLRLVLNVLVRLFAPFVPYITEEVWSWVYADETFHRSVHTAPWPTVKELATIRAPESTESFDVAIELMAAINKKKTDLGASVGRVVRKASIAMSEEKRVAIEPGLRDVISSTKIEENEIVVRVEPLGFVIDAMEVAPKVASSE